MTTANIAWLLVGVITGVTLVIVCTVLASERGKHGTKIRD